MKRRFFLPFLFLLAACGGGGSGTPGTGSDILPGSGLIQMGGSIQGKSLDLAGASSTLAGAPLAGSQDGTGADARFSLPSGVTTDGTNLYVTDSFNHTIRKVEIATGAVSTVAGTAGVSGSIDNTGAAARFFVPFGVTTDGTNLFVTDTGNATIRRVVIATGAVTTLAGSSVSSGSADGTGAEARFFLQSGITTDGTNLYVADTFNHTIRRVVIATGTVSTVAGTAGVSGSADGTGAEARFLAPFGITTDGTNLYVADSNNHTIRRVVIATGAVSTVAGTAGVSGSADGTGAAARFFQPTDLTTDGARILVADHLNNTVRTVQ